MPRPHPEVYQCHGRKCQWSQVQEGDIRARTQLQTSPRLGLVAWWAGAGARASTAPAGSQLSSTGKILSGVELTLVAFWLMRHGPSDSETAHQAAVSKQATESSPVGSLRGCPLARARTLMACAFIMIRAEVTVASSY